MKETEFLGALLPSSPDFVPIIEAVREKYKLPPISPDDDPIEEIYLGNEIVSLAEFRQDIGERVRENLSFLPPSAVKQYEAGKTLSKFQKLDGLDAVPDNIMLDIEKLVNLVKAIASPVFQGLEGFIDNIADMLYVYLLTGESGEVPSEWISKVMTMSNNDETTIMVMVNQLADPEEIVRQFRHEYQKTFGTYRPKITKKVVTTAYYLQLKRLKKPWNYIVEEFIRLEDIYMPKNKSSKEYIDHKRRCEDLLKKRMRRSEKILDEILRDKK